MSVYSSNNEKKKEIKERTFVFCVSFLSIFIIPKLANNSSSLMFSLNLWWVGEFILWTLQPSQRCRIAHEIASYTHTCIAVIVFWSLTNSSWIVCLLVVWVTLAFLYIIVPQHLNIFMLHQSAVKKNMFGTCFFFSNMFFFSGKLFTVLTIFMTCKSLQIDHHWIELKKWRRYH